MRRTMTIAAMLALCALVACATDASAQRGVTDNPYPRTLKTPADSLMRTKAMRTKFHRDSLLAQYPVSVANEACWRFSTPEKVTNGAAGFCYRDRGGVIDSALVYGALHTFYRGKWGNVVPVWTNAKTPAASLVFGDETRRSITFGLDSAVKH